MTTEFGTWLRAQREQRGWSRATMARQLITAAKDAGDSGMPGVETIRGYIYRWERGTTRTLTERYVLPYCNALDIQPADFGPQPGLECDVTPTKSADTLPVTAGVPFANPVAYRGVEAPETRQPTVRHEVLMAAYEGSEHAANAEARGIGETTLDQLRADLVRLAHESDTGQPFEVFLDLRRVRERVYQLLDRRLWPSEQADLYFILGTLNGLMGVTADRLGYPDSAEELMRAGWAYATAIDHRPLLAALRTRLSSVAFWRGMYRKSLNLAEDGLRFAAAGPEAADLHLKYAQAAVQLGDSDTARRAVSAAHEAGERDHNDDLLELGGEFSLSRASRHYCAGTVLLGLKGSEREAAAEIEQAVRLYDAGPTAGQQHYFGAKALASVDLATVRLRSGALDAATAALQPVMTLPPAQRVTKLTRRMQVVRAELAAPLFSRSTAAQQLNDRIEEFTLDSVTAGLHSLPGGPAYLR
jgi:tetratricopeptide (TPR) repeat protein/transcriptional regulator with XRE-family HTH domain